MTALEKEMQAKLDSTVKAQELEEELDRAWDELYNARETITQLQSTPPTPAIQPASSTSEARSEREKKLEERISKYEIKIQRLQKELDAAREESSTTAATHKACGSGVLFERLFRIELLAASSLV